MFLLRQPEHVFAIAARAFSAALFVVFIAFEANAAAQTSTERLYAQGAYQQAAAMGEASGSSMGYTLAARALLVRCMLSDDPGDELALIDRAQRNARLALAADPSSVDARLQLAMAHGMRAQRISIGMAMREGLAPEGRRLIDEALALAPNDPWAHALSGGWHFEVVRRGGNFGARMLGASQREGFSAYQQALALAPDNPGILMQYAASLLLLDAAGNQALADAVLRRAAAAAARDAFEAFTVQQAERVGAVLREQGPQAAERAVHALL